MNIFAAKYRLLTIIILMTVSTPSYSLSCYGLQDHYFVQCLRGVCEKSFRAREIHAKGSCGRRVVIEDIPAPMVQYIAQVTIPINTSQSGNESSIYHVYCIDGFYSKAPETTEELAKSFREKSSMYAQLKSIEIVDQETNFELLKKKWIDQSDKELLQTRIYYFIDMGVLACCSILLLYTLVRYKNLIEGLFRKENNQAKIIQLLSMQGGLFWLGLMPWLFYIEGAVFILSLVPLLVIAWIYETIILFKNAIKS